MNENEFVQDDEVSLFDLWGKLRDGWRYVGVGSAIGVLSAIAAIALSQPKYEAIAVLQVGQVGGQPVESATNAVERMKTSSFQIGLAKRLDHQGWISDLQSSTSATGKYLSLQIVKATATSGVPLIELKASGDSPETAKKIADTTVQELAGRHAEIARPMTDKLRLDLTIAKEKLASAEKELEGINKLVANAGVKDDRFTQLSLMTALRVQKEAELFGQRQAIMALETALSAPATQPAKAIEETFVTDRPVSPKKGLSIALGLIGGLLAGVMSIFITDGWRRAKGRSKGELAL